MDDLPFFQPQKKDKRPKLKGWMNNSRFSSDIEQMKKHPLSIAEIIDLIFFFIPTGKSSRGFVYTFFLFSDTLKETWRKKRNLGLFFEVTIENSFMKIINFDSIWVYINSEAYILFLKSTLKKGKRVVVDEVVNSLDLYKKKAGFTVTRLKGSPSFVKTIRYNDELEFLSVKESEIRTWYKMKKEIYVGRQIMNHNSDTLYSVKFSSRGQFLSARFEDGKSWKMKSDHLTFLKEKGYKIRFYPKLCVRHHIFLSNSDLIKTDLLQRITNKDMVDQVECTLKENKLL
jgi:hypothetical protein